MYTEQQITVRSSRSLRSLGGSAFRIADIRTSHGYGSSFGRFRRLVYSELMIRYPAERLLPGA
jgi:hypothetical protein